MQQIVKKKNTFTLIELMFVIAIIALIMGVMAWNMQGVLDKGRASKTQFAIEKLEAILNLRVAEDPGFLEDLDSRWEEAVKQSPLAKNPNAVIYDGWGKKFDVSEEDGLITIKSSRYDDYKRKNPTSF